jgi:hypothetical protein
MVTWYTTVLIVLIVLIRAGMYSLCSRMVRKGSYFSI